ncbi:MAG: hypothetical protein AB8F95_04750 [Bacteroidia bacterium]
MMKKIAIISVLMILGWNVQAQTWKERLEAMEDRVKAKTDQQQGSIDKRYNNQMRRLWLEAEVHGADMPYLSPKPVDKPSVNPDAPTPKYPTRELIIVPAPKPIPTEEANIPMDEPEELAPKSPLAEARLDGLEKTVETSFFGEDVSFRYDAQFKLDPMPVLSEQRIADAWLQMDASDSDMLVYQLQREGARRRLNDWGFFQLVNRTAYSFFPKDKNARTLFNWFVAIKAGYAASACYDRDKLYLLMPTNRTMYGQSYLKGKNGEKYYAIDLDGESTSLKQCRVFNGKYPEAKRVLNFDMRYSPRLSPRLKHKVFSFVYRGKTINVPVTVDKSLVYFYKTMPFFDLDLYMQAPLSNQAMKSLKAGLLPALKGLSEEEKVSLLLTFVQKAFAYKTDQQQFGEERYLFAEETLFYPYSDCEDRSVLFSKLVQELVGLETVGLIFPGHAATAVKFSKPVDGDRISYGGVRYTICDPTYINAKIGMLLPAARNKQARVIESR